MPHYSPDSLDSTFLVVLPWSFNPLKFSFTLLSYLFTKCVSLWYKALNKFLRQKFFSYNLFLDIKKSIVPNLLLHFPFVAQKKFKYGIDKLWGWVGKYGDDYSSDPTFHLVMVKVWLKNERFFFLVFFMYYILKLNHMKRFAKLVVVKSMSKGSDFF